MRLKLALALLGAAELAAAVFSSQSAADDGSPSSSDWQFFKPTGRFAELFQLYGQRFVGLPDYQERLDGEVEFALGNGTYNFKAIPWAYLRVPDAVGGQARQARTYVNFKEAWAERTSAWVDFRAGNQIFAWGTADQINPTDVWNPHDFYDPFLSPKRPTLALQAKVHPPGLDRVSLELIGTPFFLPSRVPLAIPDSGTQPFTLSDSRWFLPFPTTVMTSNGSFSAPLQYQVTQATYPSTWQGGARLRVTSLGGWDFSASYANLVETLPRFAITTQGDPNNPALPVVVTLLPSFHREQMIGLDGAGSVTIGDSEVGTRFEGAYFFRDNSRAYEAPAAYQASLLRDDYLHFVVGADYTFQHKILGTVLYLNLQYVHYQRLGTLEQTPGQYVLTGLPTVLPWDRNLVLYWEDRIGQNSQFKFLGTFVASLQNGDGMITPAIQYAWTDNLKTQLGAELMGGSSGGFFGQFSGNSRTDLGVTYSF